MYSGDNYPGFGMAVLMAGGSLPVLPADVNKELLSAAIEMKPVASPDKNALVLSDGKKNIIYNKESKKMELKSIQ